MLVFCPTLLQGARHPDIVNGQHPEVTPRREQVVIMEEDDLRSDPDPVYTISNDIRLQQTRLHGEETQSYSRVGRHDVSQRRMVTVHDVINSRTMEGHESLGQRRVSNSSSASSDSSSSEASQARVHPYQNIPEPDQQPIRGQYSGHVIYPDQSEGGGSLSSVHDYDYPQVEKHQRLPLRGPQRQNEYYPEPRPFNYIQQSELMFARSGGQRARVGSHLVSFV